MNVQGFAESIPSNVISTTVDAGPDLTRLRNVFKPVPVKGTIVINSDGWNALAAFAQGITLYGIYPFFWEGMLPESDGYIVQFDPKKLITRSALGADWFRATLNLNIIYRSSIKTYNDEKFGTGDGAKDTFSLFGDTFKVSYYVIEKITVGGSEETDYTDNDDGTVTFDTAPDNNDKLKWSGRYLQ